MQYYEYLMLADGTLLPQLGGIPTARQVAQELIAFEGVAYFWPGSGEYLTSRWYVMLPVFEHPGGTDIPYEDLPDEIKMALMLM